MTTFHTLALLADELASNASRLKKRAAIVTAIASIHADPAASPENSGLFALFLSGQPFAEADSRKLNVGGALLTRLLRDVSQAADAAITAAYRRHGDLGAAAFDLLASMAPTTSTLSLTYIADTFAEASVAKTTLIRTKLIENLLRRATALEAKYLIKLMLGDMRIGTKQSLIEEAIALAANAELALVRNAVMLEADLGDVTSRAFAGTLAEARLRLFHPLGFMLASPVETPEEAIERFTPKPVRPKVVQTTKKLAKASANQEDGSNQLLSALLEARAPHPPESPIDPDPSSAEPPAVNAFLEDKYDGMRAQIHFADPNHPGRVAIYSRSREDITDSFPELTEAFRNLSIGQASSSPTHIASPSIERSSLAEDGAPAPAFPSQTDTLTDTPPDSSPLGPLILDGEILAWNLDTQQALPFAILGQRIGRKRVSNELRASVPVIFMAFDVMCEAGSLTLDLPLTDRRNRLEAIAERIAGLALSPLTSPPPTADKPSKTPTQANLFTSSPELSFPSPLNAGSEPSPVASAPPLIPRLHLSPARLVQSAAEIDRAYADARARANEGVMLKAADSVYQPGRRGLSWVKLKRELASLDVVITGAEYGSGRRAQLLSDYTFAVRGPAHARTSSASETSLSSLPSSASGEAAGSPSHDRLQDATHLIPARNGHPPLALYNVGKAYSGVTDAEIAQLTDTLKSLTLEDHGHFRTVEPRIILEVAFNNIMRSSRHASGFALRFPRILRIRTDKPVEEIDTLARVEEIYQSQVDKPSE